MMPAQPLSWWRVEIDFPEQNATLHTMIKARDEAHARSVALATHGAAPRSQPVYLGPE